MAELLAGIPAPPAASPDERLRGWPARLFPRRRLLGARALAAGGVAAAAVAVLLALALPGSRQLTGTEIADAAIRALVPKTNVIRYTAWHYVRERHAKAGDRIAQPGRTIGDVEQWQVVKGFYDFDIRNIVRVQAGGVRETEATQCGVITYHRAAHVARVRLGSTRRDYVFRGFDPGGVLATAKHHLRYESKTTFRGIPAYKLILSYEADNRPLSYTYIVRRDNFHPLRIVYRFETSSAVLTYSAFEALARNAKTESLLHVRVPSGVRIVRTGTRPSVPGCSRFGTFVR